MSTPKLCGYYGPPAFKPGDRVTVAGRPGTIKALGFGGGHRLYQFAPDGSPSAVAWGFAEEFQPLEGINVESGGLR